MAGKATAKPKVKNGVEKKDMSMTYIDDILLRLDKAENDIDDALQTYDEALQAIDMRVGKVEARLGIG